MRQKLLGSALADYTLSCKKIVVNLHGKKSLWKWV